MTIKKENPRRSKFNTIGLSVSTSYLLLTIIFKYISFQKFEEGLLNQEIEYVQMDTKPSPLNSILWSSLIETDKGFRTAYYSLFDNKEIIYSKEFPKNHELIKPFRSKSRSTTYRYFSWLVQDRRKKWEITFLGFKIWPDGSRC